MKNIFKAYILMTSIICSAKGMTQMTHRILAKVEADIITQSDVDSFKRQNPALKLSTKEILDELINQNILENLIKRENISIDNNQVEIIFQQRQESQGEKAFYEKLVLQGLSVSAYKDQLKFELQKQHYVQKNLMSQIRFSETELQQLYEREKSNYQLYNQVNFIEVFLKPESFTTPEELKNMAETIQIKLLKKQDVSDLIRKYSAGAFAANGGVSHLVSSKDLRPEIRELLSSLKVGEVTPVFNSGPGLFIFKLLQKDDPQPIEFAKIAGLLRSKLAETKVSEVLQQHILEWRDKFYVEILP